MMWWIHDGRRNNNNKQQNISGRRMATCLQQGLDSLLEIDAEDALEYSTPLLRYVKEQKNKGPIPTPKNKEVFVCQINHVSCHLRSTPRSIEHAKPNI